MKRALFFGAIVLVEAVLAQTDLEEAVPTVLTPTRLRQSLHDVPASVTVLTADELALYGVRSIPEALRLVPGMAVLRATGQDYRIGYHGTNLLMPRRMNVLIDGVSAYQPAFARVDWVNLPVVLEDVDRIEVTRGPDSASYGPNSMLGVVNIVTKHPQDVERFHSSVSVGSEGARSAMVRGGLNRGGTSLRITAGIEHAAGYDRVSRDPQGHDGTRVGRLSARAVTAIDEATSAEVSASFVHATREVPFVEPYQASYPDQDVHEGYVSGKLTHAVSGQHELSLRANLWINRVRQAWRSCLPTALILPEMFAMWRSNPAYANALLAGQMPTGGSAADNALAAAAVAAIRRLGARATQPTCVDTDQNLVERRAALELEDTYVVSERLRMVSGIGVRHQEGDSQTYLGGSHSSSIGLAFGHAEYKPEAWLTLNGGVYAEHDSLSRKTNVSPRLGLNVRLDARQSVRAVWSTGSRTPDVQEQRADWSYRLSNVTPPLDGARFYQSALVGGGLVAERIRSTELGYLFILPAAGLLFDVRVFEDRLSDLISEKLQVSSFEPTNTGSVNLSGVELQARAAFGTGWTAFGNYAYLRTHDASNPNERTQYSRHSGSVGVAHRFADGWTGSLAYYGASGDGIGQSGYGRTDATIARNFRVGGSHVSAALTARRLDDKSVNYYRDVDSILSSTYDRRLQILGTLSASF